MAAWTALQPKEKHLFTGWNTVDTETISTAIVHINNTTLVVQITWWNFDSWGTAGTFLGGCKGQKQRWVKAKARLVFFLTIIFTGFCSLITMMACLWFRIASMELIGRVWLRDTSAGTCSSFKFGPVNPKPITTMTWFQRQTTAATNGNIMSNVGEKKIKKLLKWKLTSGAALLGFSAPVCGLAVAEDRGLQAWVAEDSTNIGLLICVDPRRGLPRVLLDRNNGLVCPEVDWRHL